MSDMYRDLILEHHRYPHNYGTLDPHDVSQEEHNPLCGDRIRLDLRIADGKIAAVAFSGKGCAVSQAAASMLTDELIGMDLDAARAYSKDDVLELIGLPLDKNPVRLKCALLSLKAMKVGLYRYLGQQLDTDELD
ncbi:MAG: iron-sulfur cluster assembly scaffold protein [Roseiflexaceae bacterium]|jgi:nitrogen fixation NifU-like protein|nr:MAG: iron-sulfur cluster assembly scaffold protein [Chloroflexota bacterium]RLT30849.1 MAG: iron-sulfur cluster assembly scaffold protein [Chloroflexota bacterium]